MAISRINTPAVSVSGITPTSITIGPNAASPLPYGDLIVAVVGLKPSVANSATCSTPAGWTLAGSLTAAGGYGTTLGADTGNTSLYFFTKRSDNGAAQGTCTLTNTNVAWTQFWQLRADSLEWETPVSASGQRTTTPTSPISITTTGNIALTANDWVIGAMCIPTDVTTPSQFSAHTLTATGATFGTVTEVTEPDSGTGNDIGGVTFQSSVSSGSSTGTLTWGATIAGTLTNVRGPMVVVRIREKAATRERYYPVAVTTTAPTSNGPSTEQSTVFPWGTDNTSSVTEDYFELSPTKPTSNAGHSVTVTTLGQTARQSGFTGYGWYKLGAQTIPAGLWTMAGFYNSNVSANNNGNIGVSLYVWRPSTSSVVGYIYDTAQEVNGQEYSTVGNTARFGAVDGAEVTTQNGDVLIWEVWQTAAQSDTSVYTETIIYSASTALADAVLGSENNTTASAWFEAPTALVAFTAGPSTRSYGFIFD